MTAKPAQDPGPCSFCGHPHAVHTGNEAHSTGCAAPECPQPPKPGVGRCATYTSAAQAARSARWFANADKPVTITAHELAKTIHFARFGNRDHSQYSSCSCTHEAMALLGLDPRSQLKKGWHRASDAERSLRQQRLVMLRTDYLAQAIIAHFQMTRRLEEDRLLGTATKRCEMADFNRGNNALS